MMSHRRPCHVALTHRHVEQSETSRHVVLLFCHVKQSETSLVMFHCAKDFRPRARIDGRFAKSLFVMLSEAKHLFLFAPNFVEKRHKSPKFSLNTPAFSL